MQKFYVYALFDDRGVVRYIGKGTGNRWTHHERRRGSRNRILRSFVAKTMASVGEIPRVKVREGLSEAEAFSVEIALIRAIGRIDLRTGPLANMSDGGSGGDFGALVKEAKAMWSPEERQKHKDTLSAMNKAAWARLSPEEQETRRRQVLGHLTEGSKRLRATDPLYDQRRAKAISAAHQLIPLEEKKRAAALALITDTPEKRSVRAKAWHATRTPEERSATLKRGWDNLCPEMRLARVAAMARGEVQSEKVRIQQASLTPEQKQRQIERARCLGSGTRWITNGVLCRRVPKDLSLPQGWSYGKIQRPRRC